MYAAATEFDRLSGEPTVHWPRAIWLHLVAFLFGAISTHGPAIKLSHPGGLHGRCRRRRRRRARLIWHLARLHADVWL